MLLYVAIYCCHLFYEIEILASTPVSDPHPHGATADLRQRVRQNVFSPQLLGFTNPAVSNWLIMAGWLIGGLVLAV